MATRQGSSRQAVPAGLAQQLRDLRDANNPLLNVLLAACRSQRWSTPTLAAELEMNAPQVSKRIERARSRLGDAALAEAVASFAIPKPTKIHAMIDGKQLPAERIAALRDTQQIASRVNGALPKQHPHRQLSERYSAELNRLVVDEGYSSYYLARVLEVSHRAITSRLERHHFRDPCPSVAGTASGVYYGRKIGDPGQGAPRLTPQERAELRELWQAHLDGRRGARDQLTMQLRHHLGRGFSLANLAQTMSTKSSRVRYGALQEALGPEPIGAGT